MAPSNREAEGFVQTFKHSLKASKNGPGSLTKALAGFLIIYRNTPSSTTRVSLAELFMKHPLQTIISAETISTDESPSKTS